MKKRNIMTKIRKISFVSLILIVFILFINIAFAILNPSVVYCKEMNYEYTIVTELGGGERGLCKMPDGTEVSAWKFLKGEEGQKYSYCEEKGYVLKTINDSVKCSSIFSRECAVCVINGEEIEVTKLMNLSFNEGICGDNICVIEENFKICPQDCKSGSFDGYCDGVKDKICDPNCEPSEDPDCKSHIEPEKKIGCVNGDGACSCDCIGKDSDCENIPMKPCVESKSEQSFPKKEFNWLLIIIISIIILVIIFIIFVIYKKKRI